MLIVSKSQAYSKRLLFNITSLRSSNDDKISGSIVQNRLLQRHLSIIDRANNSAALSEVDQSETGSNFPHKKQNFTTPGHAYFVAIPIGNIYDISYRALEILKEVDYICAEDTRNCIKLLRHLSLPHKKLISHHEYNAKESIPYILQLLRSGNSIGIVSDAGTPGISDPGVPLADALHKQKIPLHPIPGPSAVVTALSIAGFTSNEFTFMGFIPVKGKERRKKLDLLQKTFHSVIIFEAPHRIVQLFEELIAIPELTQRSCLCCRELTKLFEEFHRGTVEECYHWLQNQPVPMTSSDEIPETDSEEDKETPESATTTPTSNKVRGEFTIVFGPVDTESIDTSKKKFFQSLGEKSLRNMEPNEFESWIETNIASNPDTNSKDEVNSSISSIELQIMQELLTHRSQKILRSKAVKLVTTKLNVPRSVVYEIALKISWT